MKMKILKIVFPVLAVAVLASCNQNVRPETAGKEASVTVRINAPSGDMATKVSQSNVPEDANVRTLNVFIYKDGVLEACAGVTNATQLVLSSTVGAKEIWAVVNGPDLSSVSVEGTSTLNELKSLVVNLDDNRNDGFVMTGSKEATLDGLTDISIDVRRLAARVVVKKITKAFSVEANQQKEFRIEAMYLTNVQGANNLGMTAFQGDGGAWFHKMQYEPFNTHPYLYEPVARVVSGTFEANKYFYAMPNDTPMSSDAYAGAWSRRLTRLVIEATLDGETMYYPVTMNLGFNSNKSYEFNEIIITKKGSPNPDIPVNSEDFSVGIEVKDWETVFVTSAGADEGVYVF